MSEEPKTRNIGKQMRQEAFSIPNLLSYCPDTDTSVPDVRAKYDASLLIAILLGIEVIRHVNF